MKVGYLDTSVLVAIAFDEPEGRRVGPAVRRLERVYSSNLLEAEFRSASHREGIGGDIESFLRPIRWVLPDRPLTAEIERALQVGQLRGADLWHLACALYLFPDAREAHFLSLDQHQLELSGLLGFDVSICR